MYFGFVDESGSPGVSRSVGDFLALSLVLFGGRNEMTRCSIQVDQLRLALGKTMDYEFHYSRNSNRVQRNFIDLMNNKMKFEFISILIRKTRDKGNASYEKLAEILVDQLVTLTIHDLRIIMDSNPLLCKNIKTYIRKKSLYNIRVREAKSHSENLIQLADYVVNVSCKNARTDYSRKCRKNLMKKCRLFIEQ